MSLRSRDLGFVRHCINLTLKLVEHESCLYEPNFYDMKLALEHIMWVQELSGYRLEREMVLRIRCLKNLTHRLCPMTYHERLHYTKKLKFYASSVLRLLTNYVKYASIDDVDSDVKDVVSHILHYIKFDTPELLQQDVSGNFDPSLLDLYTASVMRYKDIKDLENEPEITPDPEALAIAERLMSVFTRRDDSFDDIHSSSPL